MRASTVVALALCVAVTGCGTVHALSTPASGRAPTAAGNRAAARAEAARLLSLARVPPGAVRLRRPAPALPGPAEGMPAVTSLVDRVLAWRVGLPFAMARAWLADHPPRGLRSEASASSGYGTPGRDTMAGTSYSGPASRAWQSADLEISVAPAGSVSVIRVDAVIVWLDPRPVTSRPGAHPVRITVAGGCPATDRDVTGVTSPGAGLTRRLLPSGQPTAGLLCRYDGMNGRPWHLTVVKRLNGPAARRAAASISRLPLSHPDGGVTSCPMDDGSAEVLALAYPGRSDIDLWIQINGCGEISNGHISDRAVPHLP